MRDPAESGACRLIVVDDDPTGSQSLKGVPLVLGTRPEDLAWAVERADPAAFVVTNSRAASRAVAAQVNTTVGASLAAIARRVPTSMTLMSRGDSTLRGHHAVETAALAAGWVRGGGRGFHGVLLCPAFPEAGRVTAGDVHLVETDDGLQPVANTPYASDPAFPYTETDLKDWVRARWAEAGQARPAVESLDLTSQRQLGADWVCSRLAAAPAGVVVVANATTREDLQVIADGLDAAARRGVPFLARCGPSLVAARAGMQASPALDHTEVERHTAGGYGIVIVGSHVPLTSRQLEQALRLDQVEHIEVDVQVLTDPHTRDGYVTRLAQRLDEARRAAHIVVSTSRAILAGDDATRNLELSRCIARGLVEVIRRADDESAPGFLVAKGGITSHVLAADALGASRAEVVGPLLPGLVSLWLVRSRKWGTVPYVVFPGNVGDDRALADVIRRLDGRRQAAL